MHCSFLFRILALVLGHVCLEVGPKMKLAFFENIFLLTLNFIFFKRWVSTFKEIAVNECLGGS